VDLAAMRDAVAEMGGDPSRVNPLVPADLVIDHSVQVDQFGTDAAFLINVEREYERNGERYALLRWAQQAFDGFRVVPPGTGIVHQVNLEFLADVVTSRDGVAFPDTLVGTDSHTTMINGLGVVGWGVGGIEAEAALLGQPLYQPLPVVVGFRLDGELPSGATATDLVLTVTEMLRAHGVVGKFVEFHGPGLSRLGLADRATISNMSPEFGATATLFPVDDETLRYLRMTGRPDATVARVEAYAKEQGLFRTDASPEPMFNESLSLDLSSVEPSVAGPKRPQDRVPLTALRESFRGIFGEGLHTHADGSTHEHAPAAEPAPEGVVEEASEESFPASDPPSYTQRTEEDEGPDPGQPAPPAPMHVNHGDTHYRAVEVERDGERFKLRSGSVVIAAITSCTNTSNPSVMVAAGLLARNAIARGLRTPPWVKTSLAPATPARWPRRSRRPSRRTTSSAWPCSPATATSRAASTPWPGPATSPRRRSSWPSPWPGELTWTSRPSPSGPMATALPCSFPRSGRRPRRWRRSSPSRCAPRSSRATTHRSSTATSSGGTFRYRRATGTPGTRPRPTSRSHPSSRGSRPSPRRWPTSSAHGCSPCWGTA
jgi:aconitate hydratase